MILPCAALHGCRILHHAGPHREEGIEAPALFVLVQVVVGVEEIDEFPQIKAHMAQGQLPGVIGEGEQLRHEVSEAGAGLVGRYLPGGRGTLLPCFERVEPVQTGADAVGLLRPAGGRFAEGGAQQGRQDQSTELFFILPVVLQGIPGQQDGHVGRVLCINVAARLVFFEGMGDADGLRPALLRGLVQAGQQKGQEGRVVVERELAGPAVGRQKVLAEATIIAAVEGNFPHPQLRFIDHHISEHRSLPAVIFCKS